MIDYSNACVLMLEQNWSTASGGTKYCHPCRSGAGHPCRSGAGQLGSLVVDLCSWLSARERTERARRGELSEPMQRAGGAHDWRMASKMRSSTRVGHHRGGAHDCSEHLV